MQPKITQPLGLVRAAPGGEEPSVQVSAAIDPLIGVTIGEFKVVDYLAQGGMGRVYRATHRTLPKLQRAVKVLADSTKEADHSAFMKEARAASEVRGINIVALHDFGFLPEGAPYLMMELLVGETLEAYLKARHALPFMEALALTQQVLAALSAIHSAGLVHRDIKPANLFLVNDPSQQGLVVKVMDLGLVAAKPQVQADTGVGVEKEENRAGTPIYASPEQFGDLVVGPAADIYALGVVLYELVTGEVPFPERPGDTESDLPRRHLREKPRAPRVYVTDLPDEVDRFILSMLEKEPLKRPTVAAAQSQVKRLRERYRDQVREGPTQIKANPLEPPRRNTDQLPPRLPGGLSTDDALASIGQRRRPLVWAIAIIGVLLLLGLGIVVRMQPDERIGEGSASLASPTEPPAQPSNGAVVDAGQLAGDAPRPDAPIAKEEPAPSPPEAELDELATLPSRPMRQSPARVAAKPPSATSPPSGPRGPQPVLVSRMEECTFDKAFVDWARRRRGLLWPMVDASKAEARAINEEIDQALAASDCRRTRALLTRLSRLAGLPADE